MDALYLRGQWTIHANRLGLGLGLGLGLALGLGLGLGFGFGFGFGLGLGSGLGLDANPNPNQARREHGVERVPAPGRGPAEGAPHEGGVR